VTTNGRSFGLVESRADWILNMVVEADAVDFMLDPDAHTPRRTPAHAAIRAPIVAHQSTEVAPQSLCRVRSYGSSERLRHAGARLRAAQAPSSPGHASLHDHDPRETT